MKCKTCSKCGLEKDYSEFYKDSSPRNKSGRQSRCKDCVKAATRIYALEHPEWKAVQDRRYRERHPDKQKELYKRKTETRPNHYKALAVERQHRYRERNPGYGLKGNAERLKRWRKRHPEREKSWAAARRTKMKHIPAWGKPEMIEIVYQKAKQYGLEVDHIVPLKHPLVSGLHVWQNLQLLALPENRRKQNRVWPDMPGEV